MSGGTGGISSASDVDMKSGGGSGSGANPRSPLSLAHHHHAISAFNYERAMMGSHAAVSAGLGVGSSSGTVAANSANSNGEMNGNGLRITTASNENGLNNDQQLLSPVHDQQQAAAVAHQQAVAAAVAAQHHQHPHQQQQQVAQQGMSENVRALLSLFCLAFVCLLYNCCQKMIVHLILLIFPLIRELTFVSTACFVVNTTLTCFFK